MSWSRVLSFRARTGITESISADYELRHTLAQALRLALGRVQAIRVRSARWTVGRQSPLGMPSHQPYAGLQEPACVRLNGRLDLE